MSLGNALPLQQQIEVVPKEVIFYSVGEDKNQVVRDLTINSESGINNGTVFSQAQKLNGNVDALNESMSADIFSGAFTHMADTTTAVPIPGGWSERRFVFTMELEVTTRSFGKVQKRMVYTNGFTDFCNHGHSKYIPDDVKLYFNTSVVTEGQTVRDQVKFLLPDNYYNEGIMAHQHTALIRPEDIFRGQSLESIQNEALDSTSWFDAESFRDIRSVQNMQQFGIIDETSGNYRSTELSRLVNDVPNQYGHQCLSNLAKARKTTLAAEGVGKMMSESDMLYEAERLMASPTLEYLTLFSHRQLLDAIKKDGFVTAGQFRQATGIAVDDDRYCTIFYTDNVRLGLIDDFVDWSSNYPETIAASMVRTILPTLMMQGHLTSGAFMFARSGNGLSVNDMQFGGGMSPNGSVFKIKPVDNRNDPSMAVSSFDMGALNSMGSISLFSTYIKGGFQLDNYVTHVMNLIERDIDPILSNNRTLDYFCHVDIDIRGYTTIHIKRDGSPMRKYRDTTWSSNVLNHMVSRHSSVRGNMFDTIDRIASDLILGQNAEGAGMVFNDPNTFGDNWSGDTNTATNNNNSNSSDGSIGDLLGINI